MKLQIVGHAKKLLVEAGLAGWTLDQVATRAGCAKGLVLYHHKSRAALLGAVAAQLRRDRLARRVKALQESGPAAIDALWQVILTETASGEAAAWLGLLTLTDPPVREGVRPEAGEDAALGTPLAAALSLDREAAEVGGATIGALDGFAVALLRGSAPDQVREAYHRFWLGLLAEG
jgi:AcrR family transcriptional regulator